MIYCVEDDNSIRELIIYALKASGFQVSGFENSTKFWEEMRNTIPELIMLDIMLPGEDGIDILKKIRSNPQYSDIPVIMATAKGSEFDKVLGLDAGADDYLAKPFGMMEMVSRVKALLRRTKPQTKQPDLCFSKIVMDQERHIVTSNGKNIRLTLKEYELLKLFLENPDRVFSREQLLSSVWGTDFVGESRTVDVHVGTLRTKLGENGKYILTIRGVGYKLEADNE